MEQRTPHPPRLAPNRPLVKCPAWPTSHTLPRAVVRHIEVATWRLRGTGRPARREDVVALALLFFAPDEPDALIRLMTRPHPDIGGAVADLPTGRYRRQLTRNTEQLMLRLP